MKKDFFFWVWLFFGLAVSGWLWEVLLCLVKGEGFVNRGILKGPWLPIYGFGGIILSMLFNRWRKKPVTVFVLSMAAGTLIEYMAGWFLEEKWGIKWWDYSNVRWNLHGRICLVSSLLFGFGGMLLVCAAVPLFTMLYSKMSGRLRVAAGSVLLILFVMDAAYSAIVPHAGTGITFASDMANSRNC